MRFFFSKLFCYLKTKSYLCVKDYLISFGLRQPADLQLYSRERRLEILREAKQYGASIRQLVRLTGISFYIVKEA